MLSLVNCRSDRSLTFLLLSLPFPPASLLNPARGSGEHCNLSTTLGGIIVVEPAARRRPAIEAWRHSELCAFRTGGVRNWGRNRAVKTHRLVLFIIIK